VAKRAVEYLAASGAVPISVTERGTIHAGGKITSFAARWWINKQDAAPVAAHARTLAGRDPDASEPRSIALRARYGSP
jgi:hypothetical protein